MPEPTSKWDGWDCCASWQETPNIWCNEAVRTDQFQPDKFKHDQFRYQLWAKTADVSCPEGLRKFADKPHPVGMAFANQDEQTVGVYTPATSDIRPLQQTMFVPILPTKPGGEREFTFPMTPQTLGQPDVTTACCVPVIPCQPGFKNLTSAIMPDSSQRCRGKAPRQPCPFLARAGKGAPVTGGPVGGGGAPGPGYLSQVKAEGGIPAPPNLRAQCCVGLPDTFPAPKGSVVQPPFVQKGRIPDYTGALAQGFGGLGGDVGCINDAVCVGAIDDGIDPFTPKCTSAKAVNMRERQKHLVMSIQETPEQRAQRLKTMYGATGCKFDTNKTSKRFGYDRKDNITLQGNGFQWDYPKHPNRLCYVMERNNK